MPKFLSEMPSGTLRGKNSGSKAPVAKSRLSKSHGRNVLVNSGGSAVTPLAAARTRGGMVALDGRGGRAGRDMMGGASAGGLMDVP
jgi:hypothetical protein